MRRVAELAEVAMGDALCNLLVDGKHPIVIPLPIVTMGELP